MLILFLFYFILLPEETVKEKAEASAKDWVFLNYTFKRFEGLTQRGIRAFQF